MQSFAATPMRGTQLCAAFGARRVISLLGLAFGYTLRNWRALTRHTENGVLVPDNNLLESAIRPIAMGRKAYLFAASERGGHVAE